MRFNHIYIVILTVTVLGFLLVAPFLNRMPIRSDPDYRVVDADYSAVIKAEWKDRMYRLRKGCSDTQQRDKYRLNYSQASTIFFHSKKLNISICKVPKAGSTFWTMVMLIADKGRSAEKVFSIPRYRIHASSGGLTYHLQRLRSNNEQLQTNTVVVSRDPYTRLFSAFIDKFYLLRFANYQKSLANRLGKGYFMTEAGKCGYNITFEEFVNSVTTEGLRGKKVNRHWCPVYLLCHVCDLEFDIAIQQETLTRDTEQIVQELPIDGATKATLSRMFHGPGMNKAMGGVIQCMWNDSNDKIMQEYCGNKVAYLIKIWEAFKIQGYIRTNVSFPLSEFQEKGSVNVEHFTKVVLAEMTSNPQSSSDRKSQRREALVNAYRGMSAAVIAKIQEMYLMDFHIFGYDRNPPI